MASRQIIIKRRYDAKELNDFGRKQQAVLLVSLQFEWKKSNKEKWQMACLRKEKEVYLGLMRSLSELSVFESKKPSLVGVLVAVFG